MVKPPVYLYVVVYFSLNRSAIAVSSGWPVTVPGEKVEIKSSATELGVSVTLEISV